MTAAVITTDSTGVVATLNRAAEELFGVRAAEAVGRHIGQVVDLLDLDGKLIDTSVPQPAGPDGTWQGRLIVRPCLGEQPGRHLLVDVAFAPLDSRVGLASGVVASCLPVAPAAGTGIVGPEGVASATAHARTVGAVATAALDLLCETTGSDVGLIVTWNGITGRVEASRGIDDASLGTMQQVPLAGLRRAIEASSGVSAVEDLAAMFPGAGERHRAAHGPATGLMVELRAGDESIGFLGLGSTRMAWPRPTDAEILAVAAQVAAALHGVMLRERLEKGLAEERKLLGQMEALVGLTRLPVGEADEETVAGLLLERAVTALGADGGVAFRLAGERLQVVAGRGLDEVMAERLEGVPPDSLPMWSHFSSSEDATAFHERLVDVGRSHPGLEAMIRRGVVSYAAFPLRENGRLYGAFVVHFMSETGASKVDARNVDAVGRIISIAFANARMSAGLARSAANERRLTATLRTLQELTLLGASTDDLGRLARETVTSVVAATGATGGGYMLVDPVAERIDPFIWIGSPSNRWPDFGRASAVPADWPSVERLRTEEAVWVSAPDDPETGAGRVAQAVLPLRVDGRLAGLIHLEWGAAPGERTVDVHLLEPIARTCSISLATFRLRAELTSRAAAQRSLGHRLATLEDLTRIGEQAGSFEELAQKTVRLVKEALFPDAVCYLLVEPGGRFESHASAGELGPFRRCLSGVPTADVPAGADLLDGGSSVLGEFDEGRVSAQVLELAAEAGFRAFGSIPVRIGDELAGALVCLFRHPPLLDEGALDSVARIASIALANYRLRERLVSSEERYRTLFEESPEALMVTSLEGSVLDVNDAATTMFRAGREEMLGRHVRDLLAADERELARRRQLVWSEGRGTFRDRAGRLDDSEFAVESEMRVVELDRQRRFLLLLRDLSDQEQLQRELLQAQKMEAIGQLVAGVAHELNNPLAAIVGFGQVLNTDPRLPEDMRHDAELLVQETNRTRRIVQGLLDFARARPPERHPTSIAALVNSVLELQSYALSSNNITVHKDIPDALPAVDLDRAQFQQVLLNLTINAMHALRSRKGGPPPVLRVSARLVKPLAPRGAREGSKEEHRVRVTISDNGPGVPEAVRPRLFLPFFTTKRPGEGTGLGLSVSFGIVAAHDGQLWYEPGPGGVGASFIIEMPVRARRQEKEAQEPTASEQRRVTVRALSPSAGTEVAPRTVRPGSGPAAADGKTARPRVLALDDEHAIRQVLVKALASAGIECVTFETGQAALEGLRRSNFEIMLVDHRMPGLSGTEFYQAAVEMRPELAARTIFMSGDVMNPDLAEFAKARGIRLLAKPFDIPTLIRVVRETIGHERGSRRSQV